MTSPTKPILPKRFINCPCGYENEYRVICWKCGEIADLALRILLTGKGK